MQQHDTYKVIVTLVVGLLIINTFFQLPYLNEFALTIGIVSVLSAKAAGWIAQGWIKLGLLLGFINSRILLSILFFVVLLPIALISRIFRSDPLHLKTRSVESFFHDRNHTFLPDDFKNTW